MEMTLTKFLNEHCRLHGEITPNFAKEVRSLSPSDRAWYAERANVEFGISIVERAAA